VRSNGRDQDGRDQDGRDQDGRDQDGRDQDGRDQDGRDQDGREGHGAVDDGPGQLAALRRSFDKLDARLVALLAERAALSARAGALKQAHGLPVVDHGREAAAAAARASLARAYGLDSALVDDVYAVVVRHSRRLQGAG